jgi:hypothetical protein
VIIRRADELAVVGPSAGNRRQRLAQGVDLIAGDLARLQARVEDVQVGSGELFERDRRDGRAWQVRRDADDSVSLKRAQRGSPSAAASSCPSRASVTSLDTGQELMCAPPVRTVGTCSSGLSSVSRTPSVVAAGWCVWTTALTSGRAR